jgi:hypothetical protein
LVSCEETLNCGASSEEYFAAGILVQNDAD